MTAAAAKRVFLTGASAGIGLAIARTLCAAGCEVWGTARSVERLPAGLANFHPVALDLTDGASLREGFRAAQQDAGGRFDVLINNAGGGWFGPGAEMPEDELRAQFEMGVLAPILLTQLALPGLRSAPGGLVVNVTSLAARLPLPYGAAYSAAKAALSVFTAGLQMEETAPLPGGQHRVRYVDVQPGDINTGFNRVMRFWKGIGQPGNEEATASVQRSLEASDKSLAASPPPEKVAHTVRRIVMWEESSPLVACGNAWQAIGGPLAYRLLPRRLLLWTLRKNGGL